MKLTKERLKTIAVGAHIRVTYPCKSSETGTVLKNDGELVMRCQEGQHDVKLDSTCFDGRIEFEVIS